MAQDPALPKFEVPLNDKGGATSKYWYFFFQGLLANALTPSGVVPGSYTNTNLTVNEDGIITAASNGSGGGGGSLTVTDGAHTVAGTTQLTITGGLVGGATPNATLLIGNGTVQFIESAGWNSTAGPVLIPLTVAQDVLIPYACNLQQVYIMTQGGTGSCSVTLKTAAFPTIPVTDITGGVPPSISGALSYSNSVLSGWTTSFAQGALIRATLVSNLTFTSVKIFMRFA